MTDLVERMLDSAKLGNPGWHIPCIQLLREGADEIERLRHHENMAKVDVRRLHQKDAEIGRLTAANQELRELNGQLLAEIGKARATLGHPIIQACIGMNGIQFPELLEASDG